MTADEARAYLYGLSFHHERPYDTANLHPDFAVRMATAIQQARKEGIPVTLLSGFREPGDHPSAYDLEGNSSHAYGLASDVAGIGPMGSSTALRWSQIAQANGLNNPYGQNDAKEYNHWQLPRLPLEQTPELLAALKTAKASGNTQAMWNAYNPNAGASANVAASQPGHYTVDQVYNAIFGQESGYGANTSTSAKGAHGPMQITPATFAQFAKPGENIDNPEDNKAVGHRIVEKYMQDYGGDPGRVAVAYFSGPGNVSALAFKSPFKNDASDGTTRVSTYVDQVLSRLGASPAFSAAGGGASPPTAAPGVASLGEMLGQAFAGMGEGGVGGAPRTSDPVDEPPIRAQALSEDFMARAANPVPASLAAGAGSSPIAQQLGALSAQPGDPTLANPSVAPSITSGAPSMTSMLAALGSTGGPKGSPNLMNPYYPTQRFS